MAKVDRVEDLPKWFGLEKYRGCDSFGAVEWFEQLCRRVKVWAWHPDHVDDSADPYTDEERDSDLSAWRALIPLDVDPIRQAPTAYHCAERPANPGGMPVRAVLVLDLARQAHRDGIAQIEGKCGPEKAGRWHSLDTPFPCTEADMKLALLPVNIDFYEPRVPVAPIIQVDLGASDSVLKDAFAIWLKTERGSRQVSATKRSKPLYDRWARYGLLPYLDLLIWAMETDTHIPDRVMSAAISCYDAGEANLRKTLAPLAASLMRDLSGLRALAAVEAATITPIDPETFKS